VSDEYGRHWNTEPCTFQVECDYCLKMIEFKQMMTSCEDNSYHETCADELEAKNQNEQEEENKS